MQMPKNYKDIQIGWEPVTPGGHKCVIQQVTETKSQTDKDMLIIMFDMHQTDTQPMYYTNQYMADKKAGKKGDKLKWRGVGYLVVDENTEYGPRNLKAFNTAVEDSNPGFQTVWGDGYAAALKGKLVGIVFREEEYTKEDHTFGVSVKPMRYCDFNKAFEQKVPERKAAPAPQGPPSQPGQWGNAPVDAQGHWQQPTANTQQTWQQAAQEGFMQIPDALDYFGLPFN